MKCTFLLTLALAFPALQAQTRPDFSGTWKMDPTRSESAHQDVPSGAAHMTIRQTDSVVTVETTRDDDGKAASFHELLVYKLDGSENATTGDRGTKVTAKAHWDGPKLVTETARNLQDSTITTLYVLSLSPNGKEMTVDMSLTVQHGYQFQGAATTGRGKDVFVRTGQ